MPRFCRRCGDGPGGAPGAGAASPHRADPRVLARVDDLHRRRDDQAAWHEEQRLVQALLARAPERLRGAVARGALLLLGQRRSRRAKEQRSRWGKDGWDIAEHAIAVNPNDVAGYYWAAVCMGNYALGLGVVKALSQGMEGKFRDRLDARADAEPELRAGRGRDRLGPLLRQAALAQARSKEGGGAPAQGARDEPDGAAAARLPGELAASTADRVEEAKHLLDEVVAGGPGRYDAPEERRAQALAQGLMPTLLAKLK